MPLINLRKLSLAPVLVVAIATSGCGGGSSLSSAPFVSFTETPNATLTGDARTAFHDPSRADATTVDSLTSATANVNFESGEVRLPGTPTLIGLERARDLEPRPINTPADNRQVAGAEFGLGEYSAFGAWASTDISGSVALLEARIRSGAITDTRGALRFIESEVPNLSYSAGVGSFGAKTPTTATPQSAIYQGYAVGFYEDRAGELHGTSSTLTADVNFNSDNIVLRSTGTETISQTASLNAQLSYLYRNQHRLGDIDPREIPEPTPVPNSTLNFTVTITGFNGSDFSAQVNDSVGTGELSGSFYGDDAEELGGSFHIDTSGGGEYIGAFGAGK